VSADRNGFVYVTDQYNCRIEQFAPPAATTTSVIAASAGANGTIAPSGIVSVPCSGSQTFSVTPNACYSIVDVLVDGSSVGEVASYTFANVTASHAIAASFAFTTASVAVITDLGAIQVKASNDASGTTKITLTFTPPAGETVEVWRKGFGSHPTYDNGGGAVPLVPGAYPPAGWTLTAVTTTGQADEPATRDFWYYVAYAKDACDNVSTVSNETGGALNYHLGDVTNGLVAGSGDNSVTTADISLLGAHYGLSGGALAGFEYLDVGPTTDNTPNGRPTTDSKTNFEDMVIYAINYTPVVSLVKRTGASTSSFATDAISIALPGSVAEAEEFDVPVTLKGSGDLQALSVALKWDAAAVTPIGSSTGDLIASKGGIMLSPAEGQVDAALLGVSHGMTGEGIVATIRFRALVAGTPSIGVDRVTGRDALNHSVSVSFTGPLAAKPVVTETALFPIIPNPTHGSSSVDFTLSARGLVDVSVYSVDGRRVKSLAHGAREVGRYHVAWNGTDDNGAVAKSGVYFVRLSMAATVLTRAIVRLD
jgi:hypothetical protein